MKFLYFYLLEIPNALSDEEIDHVVEKAKNPNYSGGLFTSQARGGLTPEDTFKPSKGKFLTKIDTSINIYYKYIIILTKLTIKNGQFSKCYYILIIYANNIHL